MVPPDPGPRHNAPPLGYSRLLAFHICLYMPLFPHLAKFLASSMQFNTTCKDYDSINQHSHQSTATTGPQGGGRGANHDHAQGGRRGKSDARAYIEPLHAFPPTSEARFHRVFVPRDSDLEAQQLVLNYFVFDVFRVSLALMGHMRHYLDEYVRSDDLDMSSVPIEYHLIAVRHTGGERALYLNESKREQVNQEVAKGKDIKRVV